MAGIGEACSHVAAMLFKLELGVRLRQDTSASTSSKCTWNRTMKAVEYARNVDIEYVKPSAVESKKKRNSKAIDDLEVDTTALKKRISTEICNYAPQSVLGLTIKKECSTKSLPKTVLELTKNCTNGDSELARKEAVRSLESSCGTEAVARLEESVFCGTCTGEDG